MINIDASVIICTEKKYEFGKATLQQNGKENISRGSYLFLENYFKKRWS